MKQRAQIGAVTSENAKKAPQSAPGGGQSDRELQSMGFLPIKCVTVCG
ncbi:hypothetical protein [Hymenobacter qilianensis]|uniref:Uncharacterized protein n=1 Tax=Hymenobacter qilianensis TaxID=1385715 RepID=A0A7H0GSS5_9BACT|nr:hypothetical protein [Hymenobacter qilianensis]QNP51341.1 hypothetical protein H9L05_14940 [Hymenobacter qilianensis]